MQVTVDPTPEPNVDVTFQVDELGINRTATTSSGVATFVLDAVVATNNSIWDATLQIGSNMRAAASVQAVETNGSTSIGVTVSSGEVTYCAPTGGGTGTGTVTGVLGTAPIVSDGDNTTPRISLANDGITTAKIADDAVTSPKIADDAVTHGKIADLAVEHGKIGLAAVQTTNIQDNAVTDDKLADTAVTPGSYTTADITVDAQGRITSASTGSPPAGTVTSVTAGSGLTGGTITSSGTIAHGPGTFVGSEEYPVKIVVDSFGHIQVNESETTAGAYRTAVGADDASNLTTGTLPAARLPNTAVTPGSYTSADITVDAQGRLTAASSGSGGGGGSTDWKWDPTSTTYVRIFDEFMGGSLGDLIGTQGGGGTAFGILGGSGGYWDSWAAQSTYINTGYDLRGFIRGRNPVGDYKRTMFHVPQVLDNTPSDGDEAMVEFRLQHDLKSWDDAGTTRETTFWLSAFRSDNANTTGSTESAGGYGDTAKVGIDARPSQTYYRGYVYDNAGTSGSPTFTATTVASTNNTFRRIGVHYKYVSASTKWVVTMFIDGTSVYTADLTTGTGCPYITLAIYSDRAANVEATMLLDYAVLQYTAPTVAWKNITSV